MLATITEKCLHCKLVYFFKQTHVTSTLTKTEFNEINDTLFWEDQPEFFRPTYLQN